MEHFQIFDARYLITLDGSRISSESDCAQPDDYQVGTTVILQAAIVHPDQRQVLPLAPDVRNSTTASRIAKSRPATACGPVRAVSNYRRRQYSKPFEQVTARFSFMLVAKPGDHKSLYRAVLRRANHRPSHHRTPPGTP